MPENMFGWGAVIVGVLMLLTQQFNWSPKLHYLWGIIVLLWGITAVL